MAVPLADTPSQETIAIAEEAIRPRIRRTPVVDVDGSDFGHAGARFVFKLELLQHAGAFKTRGAFANLLLRDVPAAGVVAASGGNHGAAVAYAARALGHKAKIFVPEISSPAKINRIRGYDADLAVGGANYDEALKASEEWADRSGALAVHAFDSVETMSGAGTIGLELEDQMNDLDTILVAVGGGGLIGGITSWYADRIKIVAVEPELSPTLHEALAAGHPVDAPVGGVAADSLAPRQIGEKVFPIAKAHVNEALLVDDTVIIEAQKTLWKVLRVAAEPGGATALAALLSGRYKPKPGERVGVMVSGGNTVAVNFDQ